MRRLRRVVGWGEESPLYAGLSRGQLGYVVSLNLQVPCAKRDGLSTAWSVQTGNVAYCDWNILIVAPGGAYT